MEILLPKTRTNLNFQDLASSCLQNLASNIYNLGYAITFSCLCLGVCVCVCFDQRINKMKRVMRISLNFLKAKLCKDKKKGQLFFILHCPIPPHILSDSNHLDSLEAIPSHDVCKQVKYFFLLT